MHCPNCKIPAARENDFCTHCGALVPRENSDVAKYAEHRVDGEGRSVGRADRYSKAYVHSDRKNIFKEWSSIWEELQKGLTGQQGSKGQGYGQPRRTTLGKASGSPYNAPQSEPAYRRDARLPLPDKTPKKKASPIPGLFILIGIISVIFMLPNILYGIDDFDGADYQTNRAIASIHPKGEVLYELHLKDVGITGATMTEEYVKSFTLSFLWEEKVEVGYTGRGYIQILNDDCISAFFDGTTVTVPNCALEFDTEYVLQYMSFYDYEKDCEYRFTFPEDGNALIFREDGTYVFADPQGWY